MKKLITLLFSTALLSSALAQSNHRDDRDNNDDRGNGRFDKNDHRGNGRYDNNDHRDNGRYDNNDHRGNGRYGNNRTVYQNNRYSIAQRDRMIQRINREYDFKIQQVSHNNYMSRREKRRAIKSLEAQKREQIRRVYSEYNNRYVYNGKNGRNDHRDRFDRK